MRSVFVFAICLLVLQAAPVLAMSDDDPLPREHWAYNACDYLVDEGFLPAMYSEQLKSVETLTRGQMKRLVAMLLGVYEIGRPDSVDEKLWDNVRVMAETLRAEFSTMAYEPQRTVSELPEEAENGMKLLNLRVPLDHWSYLALDYMCSEGLLEGYPDGFFTPENELTRYEFAMAVARLLDSIGTPDSVEVRVIAEALREEYTDALSAMH